MDNAKSNINKMIKSLGLVFGDIGTSPIYTLTVIFLFIKPTSANITGILSLIFWTMTILVTIEYAWLAMSLGKKGEGGTIVLREILVPLLKSNKQIALVSILTFIGISLLIGDGVITPAISILSAVEGMRLIPGLEQISQELIIVIAAIIAISLFLFQKKGTERVAGSFGPLMILWFLALAISGIISLMHSPGILKAIIPYYGIKFFIDNGIAGFIILSSVILCATGGEALYADMGHLGRKPIANSWYIVFIALILNYFGQGAFLIQHPQAKNILFEMIFTQSNTLYIPFLILSIIATVIASQAMISAMFSIVYQGIATRIMPMFKIDYTSPELRSQIYIGAVNWFLLFFVIVIMSEFKESSNLAAAYGLAVTGSMTLTGIIMTCIFHMQKKKFKTLLSILVTIVDIAFLIANFSKIPHGGYWSIIIAIIPLCIILIYTSGQRKLYRSLKPIDLDKFLRKYKEARESKCKIQGSALFFARDIKKIPPYIANTMFVNNILYEDNIIVSINTLDNPFGISGGFKEKLADGLRIFEIQVGYLEVIDVELMLNQAGINELAIFYGVEDIMTNNPIWFIFSLIKKATPSFVQFYKLPPYKLHGVITRLEM